MSDEQYYLQTEKELEDGLKDIALWAKAKVVAEENSTEQSHEYTKLRVKQLAGMTTRENLEVAAGVAVKGTIITAKVVGALFVAFIAFMVIFGITNDRF